MRDKPTLVLIPGLGNNARIWAAQIEEFAAKYKVVVPDYSAANSIDGMADCVIGEVSADSFSLVGYSLGGYIALNLIKRIPNQIERLAFISTSPYSDSEHAIKQRNKMIAAARQDYASTMKDVGKAVVYAKGPHAEHARETLDLMRKEIDVDVFIRHQRGIMRRADSRSILASINCPVEVLVGEQDIVTPIGGNRVLAENITGASLQIISQAGHLLPLERPSEVNAFIQRWLELKAVR